MNWSGQQGTSPGREFWAGQWLLQRSFEPPFELDQSFFKERVQRVADHLAGGAEVQGNLFVAKVDRMKFAEPFFRFIENEAGQALIHAAEADFSDQQHRVVGRNLLGDQFWDQLMPAFAFQPGEKGKGAQTLLRSRRLRLWRE